MKAFALGLALKQKRKATRKTPIEPVNTAASHRAPSESAERSVSRARTTDEALFVGFVFSRGDSEGARCEAAVFEGRLGEFSLNADTQGRNP